MAGRKRESETGTPVISFTEHAGDDGSDLSAVIGKALRERGIGGRPPGAKSSKELRQEFGVSRTVMQTLLRELLEAGAIERIKITERDAQGRSIPNTVYVGIRKG